MGIDWIIAIRTKEIGKETRQYIRLGKKHGEWANDLYTIWRKLQDLEDGSIIQLFNDENPEYARIINSKHWEDVTHDYDMDDFETRTWKCQEIASGLASAMFKLNDPRIGHI